LKAGSPVSLQFKEKRPMSAEKHKGPSAVFIVKDHIRGHDNQSKGVALWFTELAGSRLIEIDIPEFSPFSRFLDLKILARVLKSSNKEGCQRWLERTLDSDALKNLFQEAQTVDATGKGLFFLSAGSSGAPFCLALARATGGKCACIMTPSVLGTEPFDFAIVPEHDFPRPSSNLLVTLGAPNMIREALLQEEGSLLLSRFSSVSEKRWGLLIGGDDANYTIPPSWVEKVLVPLLEEAKDHGADIFITTSRRTRAETEERIEKITKMFPNVRMLVLGTREQGNPVPGILGICERIFCTEDSVSMISEAATGGHVVRILRVGKKEGFRKKLQDLTARMVEDRSLAAGRLWGVPRFELMIESFCRRGLAQVYGSVGFDRERMVQEGLRRDLLFNEARRAAEWMIQRWGL